MGIQTNGRYAHYINDYIKQARVQFRLTTAQRDIVLESLLPPDKTLDDYNPGSDLIDK
jgi:hypothetical protein